MDLAIGLACGLTAAFCYALSDTSAAVVSRLRSSLFAAAGMQVTMLAAFALLAIATGMHLPADASVLAQTAFFGCLVGIAYLATYEALRIGPLAVVGPLLSLTGGLTVVLAVLLLGEHLTSAQSVGVVAASGGLILMAVNFDEGLKRSRLVSRGVVFALVALPLWAVSTIGLTGPIRQVGWMPVMVESRTVSATILWIIVGVAWVVAFRRRRLADQASGSPPARVDPLRHALGRSFSPGKLAIGLVAVMGILEAVGYAAFTIGLEKSQAWIVGLTSSFGPSVTLLFGLFVLGERLRPAQWTGLLFVFGSLVLISLP